MDPLLSCFQHLLQSKPALAYIPGTGTSVLSVITLIQDITTVFALFALLMGIMVNVFVLYIQWPVVIKRFKGEPLTQPEKDNDEPGHS